ncbi:MAG: cysteine desulfurase [Treponema sp.]|jgi:cysteine desulfurase|nr:cysteine desulfurase [Treponema sp.]
MVSEDILPSRHYFDWAASAIPDPAAAETPPYGNPSSAHLEGRGAREALEDARNRCAAVLGVDPGTLYFSSGATESNAMVLHSFLLRRGGGRLLGSEGEHPSVRENLHVLERLGKQIGFIPLNSAGAVGAENLSKNLEKFPDARLAAIMAVNNETGAVNDPEALKGLRRSAGGPPIHFHCDMAQALGKIPLTLADWAPDSASLSAHKLGGPRGIGLLYLRGTLEPIFTGGGQERGLRPGTENTAGALALARCLETHCRPGTVAETFSGARARWKKLIAALRALSGCVLIPADRGEEDNRFSPCILQAAFDGVPGEVMVRALDEAGFAVSTGSACSSSRTDRPVLRAMGIDSKTSLEGIRISQGWSTTDGEIDLLITAIRDVLRSLR